ncbi:DNA-directed RNA polymerase II subunit 7 [Planoprotostelium fungivorum]|uniref:DNA-directed RNA polymerase II subunit 7 n=1 Tax=Planoprotostelium fungivorum TaxID=1890364 RepID=A0A2P6MPL8_9EUKA|nr:DNA-directed RNA polymerase II subunit 7 [Planoprotostelium fungivorum]
MEHLQPNGSSDLAHQIALTSLCRRCSFMYITLERSLLLAPVYFGRNLKSILHTNLYKEIGLGKVQEGTGMVKFPIKFKAIVFKPFKGEVLDAVVTRVNSLGFFAEVGPLSVFVSKQLIPEDIHWDENSTSFIAEDRSVKIEADTEVRLKIVGTRMDVSDIFAIGSIKEDYLGSALVMAQSQCTESPQVEQMEGEGEYLFKNSINNNGLVIILHSDSPQPLIHSTSSPVCELAMTFELTPSCLLSVVEEHSPRRKRGLVLYEEESPARREIVVLSRKFHFLLILGNIFVTCVTYHWNQCILLNKEDYLLDPRTLKR